MFKNFACTLVLAILVIACSNKKRPSLSGDEPVEVADFISSFELVNTTYEINDSLLDRKEKDSFLISYKIFTEFVPDTVLTKTFGKNAKPKIYLLKRVEVENQETYLFAKAINAQKKVIYILCFNKDKKFIASMTLLSNDGNSATTHVAGIDRRYSIYRNTFLKRPDGSTAEGKEVYVFNNEAKQFVLIMTDALDDRIKEVINPIDTLSSNNKFSADYSKDKMNIVSVRDAGNPGKLNFFIHFEKNDGDCIGELKGVATIAKNNTALYKEPGDACLLEFIFTTSSVTLKEADLCGSHRGVKCSFDGTYPRKKANKPSYMSNVKKTKKS